MQKQGTTTSNADPRPPWSPFSISVISLILPAGGAVLTVLNIARMQTVRPRHVRELALATMVVFAIGLTILFTLATPAPGRQPTLDSGVSLVLSVGTAVASYVAQREPRARWRRQHPNARSSSVLTAVAWSCIYTLATALLAVPLRLIIALIAYGTGWASGQL